MRGALVCLLLLACAHAPATAGLRVVEIHARRYSYSPSEVTLKLGQPVVLELVSDDREHGFDLPELGLRADVEPGQRARVPFTPQRAGRFDFHCDIYCGSGHEDMSGTLVIEP